METHSSIPAWEIPWAEKPCGLQPTGSQRVRYDLVTNKNNNKDNIYIMHLYIYIYIYTHIYILYIWN